MLNTDTFETIKKLHDTLIHQRGMIEKEKFRWELGSNVIEELQAGNRLLNTWNAQQTTRILFGIEVTQSFAEDQNCIKLYEDITKKIGGKYFG